MRSAMAVGVTVKPSASNADIRAAGRQFWIYEQNYVNGKYIVDKDRGISALVFIEAPDADMADLKAQILGIYFDGYSADMSEIDCDCCGSRWFRAEASTSSPEVFGFAVDGGYDHDGEHVAKSLEAMVRLGKLLPDPTAPLAYLHKADGTFEPFVHPKMQVLSEVSAG